MMSNKNDGGPAFSSAEVVDHNNDVMAYAESGMTLRDYYKAHAPVTATEVNDAFWSAYRRNADLPEFMELMAEMRGAYADAMLLERAK
jgi:hypothetical protein